MIDTVAENPSGTPDLKRAPRRKAPPPTAARVDRLPPHSTEAEQGVLGCILHAPNESLGECLQRLRADAEVFYDLRHQTIYRTLVEMYDRREAIDILTLQQRLADQKQLDAIGGIAYLNALYDSIPSPANLPYYLDIVQEKFLLRKMIQTCTEIIGRVYDFEGNVETLLDQVESEVLRLNESRVQGGAKPIKQLVGTAIQTVEKFFNRKGELGGIGTGFPDLDKMTDGFHGGEMIVIAARPSMGKTSLAMNIVEHVVLVEKLPVAVFSLEMTAEALVLRMLCSIARVNLRNIREGFMSEADFPKLRMATDQLVSAPLFIDDTAGLSILQLRARARRLAQQHGIKLFVIDYLQLLHSTSRRAQENRQQEIAEISGGIKALAKELNVPVIVLSQLNRELERDKNRRPRLSDLRESGAIEQDADVVGLLYKPSSGEDDEGLEEADGVPVNLLIAKQRNGPTGDVNLTFLKPFTRFESVSKVSDEDVPEP
ncbi:MAG: replicative DNA helicase [Verrucomicrobiales bacterium]|nr:replicative DNA helicase [Verrucomicrobiales bacterium]